MLNCLDTFLFLATRKMDSVFFFNDDLFYPPTLDALDCFLLGFEAGKKGTK